MLFKVNGGIGGWIIGIVLLILSFIGYILYCYHLGKKYILECSTCGHRVKKKFLIIVNHGFYKTYCEHCHKKEYFTAVEDK